MHPLIVGSVPDRDPNQIVRLPRHQIAFAYIRAVLHGRFEGPQVVDTLIAQRDAHENAGPATQRGFIQSRRIPLENTGLLKRLYPPVNR